MVLLITAIILLLFLAVSLFIILWGYKYCFYVPSKRRDNSYDIPNNQQCKDHKDFILSLVSELDARPYEEVRIIASDKLKLFGKLYIQNPDAPFDICFHGWRGTGLRDFSGGSKISFESGHNVLLVDQRGQNQSGGHTITFGVKERLDVLSWIEYINQRFGTDKKIFLVGVSMGAATVLMVANLPLPQNVAGIIADCPYSSPRKIMEKVCQEDMHLPAKLLYPFIFISAFCLGHFKLNSVTAAESVKDCKLPIMIIHGTGDSFVPAYMSEEIAKANPKIQRYTFEGADHGLSYINEPERYTALVKDFMETVLQH